MNKFSFRLILLFIVFTTNTKAQITMSFSDPSATGGNYGYVNVVDPSTIGKQKIELINYSDIEGSPFYSQKWSKAFLY